jgi:hypothetical protein
MSPSINDFSDAPVQDAVDFDNLPQQMGSFSEPPQPGAYRFQLPKLTLANFEQMDDKDDANIKRVRLKLDQNAPLLIVQSLGGKADGEPFQTQLNNKPRRRGRDADAPMASDLDYLLQALGVKVRPTSPKAWVETLIAQSEKTFGADIEWSWRCADDKVIYADDGAGGQQEVPGQMGCGSRYYQKSVDKVEGKYPYRIVCNGPGEQGCGASVRAYANLGRFRA